MNVGSARASTRTEWTRASLGGPKRVLSDSIRSLTLPVTATPVAISDALERERRSGADSGPSFGPASNILVQTHIVQKINTAVPALVVTTAQNALYGFGDIIRFVFVL